MLAYLWAFANIRVAQIPSHLSTIAFCRIMPSVCPPDVVRAEALVTKTGWLGSGCDILKEFVPWGVGKNES